MLSEKWSAQWMGEWYGLVHGQPSRFCHDWTSSVCRDVVRRTWTYIFSEVVYTDVGSDKSRRVRGSSTT